MEDIFEILIYLLFIGASVIGGIYKNYSKKKEEERKRQRMQEAAEGADYTHTNEPVSEIPSSPRTLEDFLREQFEMEAEPTSYEQEAVSDEDEKTEEEALVSEGVAAFKNTTDTLLSDNLHKEDFSISDEIKNQKENSIITLEEIGDEKSDIFNEMKEFDAKKAVVYSEILRRPFQ